MPLTGNDLSGVYDGDVLSASGEKIGSVGQIYLDDQTGEPTFVTASTGLFGTSQSFVPLRGARVDNGNVVVDFDKTTVKDAPRIDDDGSLSPAEEDQLYAYYGIGRGAADTADYGTADQTPQAGYASSDDAGVVDRRDNDEGGGDWPGPAEDRAAAARTMPGGDSRTTADRSDEDSAFAGIDPKKGTADYGAEAKTATVGDSAPASTDADDRPRMGRDEDSMPAGESAAPQGQGQPDERPTR